MEPGLLKDKALFDRLIRSFKKRVAYRCVCDINDIKIEPLLELFDRIDVETFVKICKFRPNIASKMFNFIDTITRSQTNVS